MSARLLPVTPAQESMVSGGGAVRPEHQLLLATWFSPAFPIGGFGYSHGVETAIGARTICDGETLRDWIALLLTNGSGWNDGVLAAGTYRAALEAHSLVVEIAALAAAAAPSAERYRETTSLGRAFLKAVEAGWPHESFRAASSSDGLPYPVAVGIAAAGRGLPLTETIAAMLNGFATTLISVAVRLVPLGQTTGLEVLAGLQPIVLSVADRAARSTLDDLGSAAILSDIAAMRHETLYSRIFRS